MRCWIEKVCLKAWTDFVHAILSKNYLKAWTDFVERTLMTVLYKMITLARCFLFKCLLVFRNYR